MADVVVSGVAGVVIAGVAGVVEVEVAGWLLAANWAISATERYQNMKSFVSM